MFVTFSYSSVNGATHINSDTSDSDEGGVYILPEDLIGLTSQQTKIKKPSRSDDEGDFIEEDMPRNSRYSIGSSNSNTNSLA